MRTSSVRIIQEQMPPCWYAGKLGEIFEVYVNSTACCPDYILKEDYDGGDSRIWRTIPFADAEEMQA